MEKHKLIFKKGWVSLDNIHIIGNIIAKYSHKPSKEEADDVGMRTNYGDLADYDIFEKDIKVTIEIL